MLKVNADFSLENLYERETLFPTSDVKLKSPISILAEEWWSPSLNNSEGFGFREEIE